MKDHITISISSIHGSKHFSLGKRTRHTVKFISGVIFLCILITAAIIYYLVNDAEFSKLKLRELEDKSLSLSKEIKSLTALKINLEQDLSEREERMQLVSDRLDDLEKLLGMENLVEERFESRLNVATINSSIRVAMLTHIPSGPPVKHARTSSGYGERKHPVTGIAAFHRGQDFAVNVGTPIYAPADGAIESVRPSSKGSGNYIRILHAYGFSSLIFSFKQIRRQPRRFC
ncbi:M23 family metallopeptidase [Marinomonas rhodophyticola]|uniref:Peptidoglycan DD-metalloendopeptidase family protein n=1 Tax=Marinomonas rhodophyticola TaxID=2992803 RepID=A0ABT3KDQ4_9GAMM|nr:peptidoglycan DD-metalloendopeptidase family protein [Marinomonas sp. KJ51-3]MCW4628306.1 peptidoglycan DD-metalloendopeptidase family protein [Marinomonas sp. KJ51-3]